MRVVSPPILALFLGISIFATAEASMVSFGTPFAAPARFGELRPSERPEFGVARTSAILDRLFQDTNDACRKASLTHLVFVGVKGYEDRRNYCESEVAAIPPDALALVEKAGELHARTAKLFGRTTDELFPYGMRIDVTSELLIDMTIPGSLFSRANGAGIRWSALPDWTIADFSPHVYAHELVHTLAFNGGPVSEALLGLQEHPFLIEALPDLVSAAVNDVPKLELGERDLPECLRLLRDGTPRKSFDDPFGTFYPLALSDAGVKCCESLDLGKQSPYTNALCDLYVSGQAGRLAKVETFVKEQRLVALPFTDENLRAPFEAGSCRIRTETGLTYLDNCDTHQYGQPLLSFFFRLRELTGKLYVREFLAKIREGAERSAVYECGFAGPEVTPDFGGTKAYVGIRPVLGSFMDLREAIPEKAAFDQAWKEHGFGKLVDLDRIYRHETLGGLAQIAVKTKNTIYKNVKGCGEVYKFDPVECRVECVKKL